MYSLLYAIHNCVILYDLYNVKYFQWKGIIQHSPFPKKKTKQM